MDRRDFMKAALVVPTVTVIPCATANSYDGEVIEWRYDLFDWANQMGVCGITADGRRMAARFYVPYTALKFRKITEPAIVAAYPELVAKAKREVIKSIAEGRWVRDEMLEGNEVSV